MKDFIELTRKGTEGQKTLVNVNSIAYISDYGTYSYIIFNASSKESKPKSISVNEQYEQVKSLIEEAKKD